MPNKKTQTVLEGLFRILVLCENLDIEEKDIEQLRDTKEFVKNLLRKLTDGGNIGGS